jgi:hypothetical protein
MKENKVGRAYGTYRIRRDSLRVLEGKPDG